MLDKATFATLRALTVCFIYLSKNDNPIFAFDGQHRDHGTNPLLDIDPMTPHKIRFGGGGGGGGVGGELRERT